MTTLSPTRTDLLLCLQREEKGSAAPPCGGAGESAFQDGVIRSVRAGPSPTRSTTGWFRSLKESASGSAALSWRGRRRRRLQSTEPPSLRCPCSLFSLPPAASIAGRPLRPIKETAGPRDQGERRSSRRIQVDSSGDELHRLAGFNGMFDRLRPISRRSGIYRRASHELEKHR